MWNLFKFEENEKEWKKMNEKEVVTWDINHIFN